MHLFHIVVFFFLLTNLCRVHFPILINLMSPLSFFGPLGVTFHFYFIFRLNRIAPDGTPRFAASHLGLFCLLMSHKKDARLIWVNKFEPNREKNKVCCTALEGTLYLQA